MSNAIEEKNKALVLKAFNTLFNQRDYVTAERYWSPRYIQHKANIVAIVNPVGAAISLHVSMHQSLALLMIEVATYSLHYGSKPNAKG